MPELRLVVLALQDKLAYGPTFESAMAALFGGGSSSLSAPAASAPSLTTSAPNTATPGTPSPTDAGHGTAATAASQPPANVNALVAEAGRDLADYQRLTAEGKLGEAGQKLEALKRVLDKLNQRQK